MTFASIQHGFSAGEISPRLFGRTDLAKYALGCSTLRNFYVDYRGGASTRAGLAYVGMCRQGAPNLGGVGDIEDRPRDIPFQFSINQGYVLEFGEFYMRIKIDGGYVTQETIPVSSVSAAGVFTTGVNHGYVIGDWVFNDGNEGFSGLTWIVNSTPALNTFTVTDLFGHVISSATVSTTGAVNRIYNVASPYAAPDLAFLKYTQSADTMTLTCVNQETSTEYPSYELVRNGAINWVFTADSFGSAISAPTGLVGTAQSSTTLSTYYSYVVTAIDATTGDESVASRSVNIFNNDIAINAGSNTITWNTVTNASSYNIYAAIPSYSIGVPAGASFGYVGTSFGNQFTDTNIIADFTVVPPVHRDPFARGAIASVTPTAGGASYSQSTTTTTINTGTGTGGIVLPIVVANHVVAFIVQNGGKNYVQGDTITINSSGSGHGATATVTVGPVTGTYPAVCAYFQQRRAYAYTLNAPDTYFMSQPGAFNNMDSSIPVTDSDAIVGSPWSQQIDGIQFLVPMPGGLIILTGRGAWQLTGTNGGALTPSDQVATPQAYNGCHFHIPPIVINYDILYVQSKGSIIRDLSYNFFVNIYTGTDMTVLSEHLFNFHQMQQWAYAEEPFKLVWIVRDDGAMLSLTYLKEQDIYGWARHDTNGIFICVCSITEPPVDALYVITQRYISGEGVWVYYSERMDNRNWQIVESNFCVDAGLQYPMSLPSATLYPAAADGTNNISNVLLVSGGTGYIAPIIAVHDPIGGGTGATFSATVTGGVITAITVVTEGQNYAPGATIEIIDTTGSGAIAYPIVTNIVEFTTSSAVFADASIGDVIRIGNNNENPAVGFPLTTNGGGKAVITAITDSSTVQADIIEEITNVLPNNPDNMPVPVSPNQWSLSTPVDTVTGLNHLEGMEVAILADGSVVTNQTVTDGQITLPVAASAIVVGLPYLPQLQTLYLDVPSQTGTTQGKRKNIQAVTVRVQNTRGISVGTNQPDQSTQPNNASPAWTGLYEMKARNSTQFPGTEIPLFTGDLRELVSGSWQKPGQVAIQQNYPLEANILTIIPEWTMGDSSG